MTIVRPATDDPCAVWECGKRRMTRDVARQQARKMRRRGRGAIGEYLCRHCGWWHVGNANVRRRRRR